MYGMPIYATGSSGSLAWRSSSSSSSSAKREEKWSKDVKLKTQALCACVFTLASSSSTRATIARFAR
eukprot:m.212285 g.212285  ORF g.212285 m.212285 type:complete len:67 (+) comp25524_c0_seq1:83-283(+)